MNDRIDIKIGEFRITNISTLDGLKPIKEGLGVEKQNRDGETYFVIAFVYDDDVKFIGDRVLDLPNDEFPIFREMCKIAKGIVSLANDDMLED